MLAKAVASQEALQAKLKEKKKVSDESAVQSPRRSLAFSGESLVPTKTRKMRRPWDQRMTIPTTNEHDLIMQKLHPEIQYMVKRYGLLCLPSRSAHGIGSCCP